MKNIFVAAILGLAFLLAGCGNDDGKYAGTWDGENGFSRYILTPQDDGYKVQYQRQVSNGKMIDDGQMFFKKSGSYLASDNDPHFLEILNDHELKLTSTGKIFNKAE